ncbi:DEKNAAC100509 [Brettanomyces naardenensis]|uniref:Anaphase-promoting complex subunit 5 n=1 Tax=Brettanomyces naardenensis TaxID=13370 RepID=A0A448YFM1_BRENA|nr:DEKNAAC100509 [Brettanomyces naardenensis]
MSDNDGSLVFTPILATSKVPILVLITGYCYREFPARSIPPILSTLVELIEGGKDSHSSADEDIVSVFFPSLNQILDKIEHSILSFFDEPDLISMKEARKDILQIQDYLLRRLWSIDNIDSFYTFLKGSQDLLVEKAAKPVPGSKAVKLLYSSSFLGKFVSSISVASDVLVFGETIRLWRSFCDYRGKASSRWNAESYNKEKRNNHDAQLEQQITASLEIPHDEADVDAGAIEVYSQVDLAQLLEFQVHKLQIYAGALPSSLRRILTSMSESQRSIVPSSYYIEYLECWKMGDYEGSFDALHRYFDYMMSNKQQLFYHYALLSLATLHSSFGSDYEALRAIDEAILVARENKDLDCLNYLLTWLFDFLRSRPQLSNKIGSQPGREQVLQFLKLKTKENKNSVLQSMAYQHEAIKQMLEGFPLRKVLNNLTRAFYILLNLDSSLNTKMSFARACQLAVTVWSRVGIPSMANLYIDAALESAGSDISIFDEVELILRRSILLYQAGRADDAFKLLQSYEGRVAGEASLIKTWQTRYTLLKVNYWLRKSRFGQAAILLDKLKSQISEIHEYDLKCEVDFQLACYEDKVGNATKAIQIISRELSYLKETENSYNNFWIVKFQILYAQVVTDHSSAPERTLSVLLNSLETAHRSSLLTLIVEGTLVLCDLLLKIDQANSAPDVDKLLKNGMPNILEVGNLWLTSKAYYLLSKVTLMNTLQSRQGEEEELQSVFQQTLSYLQTSITGFRRLQDFEWVRKALEVEKSLAELTRDAELASACESAARDLEIQVQNEAAYDAC